MANANGVQVGPDGQPIVPASGTKTPTLNTGPANFSPTKLITAFTKQSQEDSIKIAKEKKEVEEREKKLAERSALLKKYALALEAWRTGPDKDDVSKKPDISDADRAVLVEWGKEMEKEQEVSGPGAIPAQEQDLVKDVVGHLGESVPKVATGWEISEPDAEEEFLGTLAIPTLILNEANSGRNVPLYALTPKALQSYRRSPPSTHKVSTASGSINIVKWDVRDECLSVEDFRYAISRWRTLFRNATSAAGTALADIFKSWEALLERVLNWPELAENIEPVYDWIRDAMVEWCSKKRAFNPTSLWRELQEACSKYRIGRLEARNYATSSSSSFRGADYQGGRTRTTSQSSRARDRPAPYPTEQPFRDEAYSGRSRRCFRCGARDEGHSAKICESAKTSSGTTPVSRWDNKNRCLGSVATPGKSFCLAFQTGRCSKQSDAICKGDPNVLHQCSICGKGGHGAAACA